MKLLDIFTSDIWFLFGFIRDIPELIWLWITDREEYDEMLAAVVDDIRDYFSEE